MKKLILLPALLVAWTVSAQTTNIPLTYFERFDATVGAPLLKSVTVIGELNNQINYPTEIRAERLTNLQASNTVYGVSIRTHISTKQTDVDYIDYDELDGLIRGIQLISQTDHAEAPMDSFEAAYRTRCGLSIIKVSKGGKLNILIRSGTGDRNQMASFVLDDLGRYLMAAKAKLDSVASGGQ